MPGTEVILVLSPIIVLFSTQTAVDPLWPTLYIYICLCVFPAYKDTGQNILT